jgi:hypothetical protein
VDYVYAYYMCREIMQKQMYMELHMSSALANVKRHLLDTKNFINCGFGCKNIGDVGIKSPASICWKMFVWFHATVGKGI